jgi:protein-S-isoprenylcysteine O-methyltransferase Ste14
MRRHSGLFLHALLALIALPTMVAGVVPWLLRPTTSPSGIAAIVGALALAVSGLVLLLWCVVVFYRAGRGTLAPWVPPESLVTVGPYRFSRNPMYIAVLCILASWALVYHTRTLWVYVGGIAVLFAIRVRWFEEPLLARTDRAAWDAYAAHVPRWIGHVS